MVTGDLSASMTTTNSIMPELVLQIKDGICVTKKMDPIASKAINKEAVMFQRMLIGGWGEVSFPSQLETNAWPWSNGIYSNKEIHSQ